MSGKLLQVQNLIYMPKIIYEKEVPVYIEGEGECFSYESISYKHEIIDKVINVICSSGASAKYLIHDNLFKPKEISFEKIFSDIENETIKFQRSFYYDFRLTKTIFTDNLFEINSLRTFELTNREFEWKMKILFYPLKFQEEILDEIHMVYSKYHSNGYSTHITIYSHNVFTAEIWINI